MEQNRSLHTRWKLTKVILCLSTFAFFVPAIINFILQFSIKTFNPLILLGSSEWVAIITLVVGIYSAGNVAKDNIFKDNGKVSVKAKESAIKKDSDKKESEKKDSDEKERFEDVGD